MADNVTAPATSQVFATDDIGGVQHPRTKVGFGIDGVYVDVSSGNPLPVSADALPLPTGAATEASLALLAAATALEDSPSPGGERGIVMLAQRRDSDSAATSADNDYATLKMDEAGRLKTASQPAAYALVTGSITANAQTVFIDCSRGSNIVAHMVATSLVGHNCTFEGSIDSTNGTDGAWFAIQAIRTNANTIELTTGVLAATPAYGWELSVNGLKYMRVRATAHTSGTAAWKFQQAPYATEPIPGAQVSATQPVSGAITANGTTGAVAHDAVISGFPVRIGGRAMAANYTAVAGGDTADLIATLVGALVVKPFSIPESDWSAAAPAGGIVNLTDQVLIAALASNRRYLTGLQIGNSSAVATEVVIKDGATVIWRGHFAANSPMRDVTLQSPLKSSVNAALNAACLTTGAAVYVNAQGYTAP